MEITELARKLHEINEVFGRDKEHADKLAETLSEILRPYNLAVEPLGDEVQYGWCIVDSQEHN